jgi:iron complex outermembrane receptor protein
VTLLAGIEDEDTGRIVVEWFYIGRQRLEANPFRNQSVPYAMVGLLAERVIGKARVFVNGENLTNFRQVQYDPLILPRPGVDGRWVVDAWGPLDGRNINAGIRFTF